MVSINCFFVGVGRYFLKYTQETIYTSVILCDIFVPISFFFFTFIYTMVVQANVQHVMSFSTVYR